MLEDVEFTPDGHPILYVAGYNYKPEFHNGRESWNRVGIGIYWAGGHPNNRSIRLLGRRASADQAVIWAVLIAIRQAAARGYTTVVIRTEDELIARAISEWMPRWKVLGWRTSDHRPVRNRTDFETLDVVMATMARVTIQIAQSDTPRAEGARELARLAADKKVQKLNQDNRCQERLPVPIHIQRAEYQRN